MTVDQHMTETVDLAGTHADALRHIIDQARTMTALDDHILVDGPGPDEDRAYAERCRQGVDDLLDELPRLLTMLTPAARYVLDCWVDHYQYVLHLARQHG